MTDYVIRSEHLGKQYHISKLKKRSMLRDVVNETAQNAVTFIKSIGKQKETLEAPNKEVWAVKDISFNVEAGESVGVIGSNGAGKSTLLKILSRITTPTTGKVTLRGRVGSLLEVGTGFHSELTGRENIFLNGAILGMKRREIVRKFDEIVSFSEISDYLDTPVKHYSSGMRMRLAFSVAAHLEPEILLIDEVLAVGDVAFQRKSINKMNDVVSEGRTVLFVSHNMAAIRSLCQKAIYIDKGMIKTMGDVDSVIKEYLDANEGRLSNSSAVFDDTVTGTKVLSVTVLDKDKTPASYLPHDHPIIVQLALQFDTVHIQTGLTMRLFNQDLDLMLVSYDFEDDETRLNHRNSGRYIYNIIIPENILPPGKYFLGFEIFHLKAKLSRKGTKIFHQVNHISPFEVYDNGSILSRVNLTWKGTVHIPIKWQLISED